MMPNAIGKVIDVCLFSVAKVENEINRIKYNMLNDLNIFSMKKKASKDSNKVNTSGKKVLLSDKVSGLNAKQNKIIKRRGGEMLSSFKIELDTITNISKLAIEINRKSVNENPNSLVSNIPLNNCGTKGSDCQSENLSIPELT